MPVSAIRSEAEPQPRVARFKVAWRQDQASARERDLVRTLGVFGEVATDAIAGDDDQGAGRVLTLQLPSAEASAPADIVVVEGRAEAPDARVVWALGAPFLTAPDGERVVPIADALRTVTLSPPAARDRAMVALGAETSPEAAGLLAEACEALLAGGAPPLLTDRATRARLVAARPALLRGLLACDKAERFGAARLLQFADGPDAAARAAAFADDARPVVQLDPAGRLAPMPGVHRARTAPEAVSMLTRGLARGLARGETDESAAGDAPATATPVPLHEALSRLLGAAGFAPPMIVARNLGVETEVQEETYNAATRLLSYRMLLRGAVPEDAADAAFGARDGQPLYNVNVAASPVEGGVFLSAFVVLPLGIEPEDVALTVTLRGAEAARFEPSPNVAREAAGAISLEPTPDGVVFDYWSLGEADAQMGRRVVRPAARGETSTGLFYNRALGGWPFDRASLTLLGEDAAPVRVRSFAKWTEERRPSSHRLAASRDAHRGKTAWLIGNGPSVRTEDLDRLAGRSDIVTFAFNRFHLAHDATALRADYTVSGDRQIIADFGEEIIERTEGQTVFADRDPVSVRGDYIWLRQVEGFPSLFSKDASRAVSPGGSSVYLAMQLAYFMGLRRFYLYGADFKFTFARDAQQADTFRRASGDGNHFIQGYRSGKAWCPPSVENIVTSFLAARLLMEHEGGFVRNATHGGLLEVFERERFDHAVRAG